MRVRLGSVGSSASGAAWHRIVACAPGGRTRMRQGAADASRPASATRVAVQPAARCPRLTPVKSDDGIRGHAIVRERPRVQYVVSSVTSVIDGPNIGRKRSNTPASRSWARTARASSGEEYSTAK